LISNQVFVRAVFNDLARIISRASHRHEHCDLSRWRLSSRLRSRHLVVRDHDLAFCALSGHSVRHRVLILLTPLFFGRLSRPCIFWTTSEVFQKGKGASPVVPSVLSFAGSSSAHLSIQNNSGLSKDLAPLLR